MLENLALRQVIGQLDFYWEECRNQPLLLMPYPMPQFITEASQPLDESLLRKMPKVEPEAIAAWVVWAGYRRPEKYMGEAYGARAAVADF